MRSCWAILVGLLLTVAGPAAADGAEAANPIRAVDDAPPRYVEVATVDSSTPTARVRAIATRGNPTLYVAAASSTYSGAITVQVDLYGPDTADDVDTDPDWLGTTRLTFNFATSNGDRWYDLTTGVGATSTKGATLVDVKVVTNATGGAVRIKRWLGTLDSGARGQ